MKEIIWKSWHSGGSDVGTDLEDFQGFITKKWSFGHFPGEEGLEPRIEENGWDDEGVALLGAKWPQ